MKLMMIFVFVYALGIMTLLTDGAPEYNEPEERGQDKCCTGWHKVNVRPVCFEAKDMRFGSFQMPFSGSLAAIKLVHLYGYISCDMDEPNFWSFWGCGHHSGVKDMVNVVITKENDEEIFLPPSGLKAKHNHGESGEWYYAVGYNSWSPELVLSVNSTHPQGEGPVMVSSGETFHVWYAEQWKNYSTHDNGGRVCCDVYAHYV